MLELRVLVLCGITVDADGSPLEVRRVVFKLNVKDSIVSSILEPYFLLDLRRPA